jgi:type II secretory pathway component PulF
MAATISIAIVVLLEVGALRLVVGPSFARMFADFGNEEGLPWLAREMTTGFAVYGLALFVAFAAAAAAISGWSTRRPAWATGAFAGVLTCAIALFAVFVAGAYLPVFELASSISGP